VTSREEGVDKNCAEYSKAIVFKRCMLAVIKTFEICMNTDKLALV